MKNKSRVKVLAGAESTQTSGAFLYHADALQMYEHWPAPTCIIADGPYGLGKFPGEPKTPHGLAEWYAPHVAAWSKFAASDCTLWFWNTELGWASMADDQKEALEMAQHKIARILNGDPNYLDNWVDLVGYSQLVVNRLEKEGNAA